jgi:prepilin-type N-terminal cleavage/methylation domain-containing protein
MRQTKQLGFTLLEVLIAMTIFSTITIFAAQALRQALFNKSKIQSQLDEMSRVRDALNIIRKDLELATHYLDFESEFNEAVKKQARGLIQKAMSPDPSPNPKPQTPGSPPPPVTPEQQVLIQQKLQELEKRFSNQKVTRLNPATHFRGLEDKMFFVTSNTISHPTAGNSLTLPLYMTKVSYQLKPCPLSANQNCLIRYSDSTTDGDIEDIQKGVVLLEGVSEFSLRYLGKRQQDWVRNWDSRQENAAQKNLYPEAIEVTLTRKTGESPNEKTITMQSITYLHYPNNPPDPNLAPGQRRGVRQ